MLAGGRGTRLFPLTAGVNKHLLPVHDLPVLAFPLDTLLESGIRRAVIVSDRESLPAFERWLGSGERFGMQLDYAEQRAPRGIPDAIEAAAAYVDDRGAIVVLGDTFLVGAAALAARALSRPTGATIVAASVPDTSAFGTVEVDAEGAPIALGEKSAAGPGLAVPGLYVYDQRMLSIVSRLSPSERGELEVADLNRDYLERRDLVVERLPESATWLDLGSVDALAEAARIVTAPRAAGARKLGCLEELAFRLGYLTNDDLRRIATAYPVSAYRAHLLAVARG